MKHSTLKNVAIAAGLSVAYVVLWRLLLLLLTWQEAFDLRATVALYGLIGLFVIGLGWSVWGLEQASQYFERRRHDNVLPDQSAPIHHKPLREEADEPPWIWNPLDPAAWYYGRRHKRLNQSISALTTYSVLFFLVLLLLSHMRGCGGMEIFESPAGGGKPQIAQKVKIQKVKRIRHMINPLSAVLWNPPPIDKMVNIDTEKETRHAYTVGYGKGEGAGFAGGTSKGKVRLVRLEYTGGDWNQNFGIGGDLNMLNEYGIRTGHKIAKKTESRRVSQLANIQGLPLVYMTGQRNISLSDSEKKILRKYLLEKHGMVFCSNGGSRGFHNQFVSLMNDILDGIRPVPVPLDDPIHSKPNHLPFLPIVAPHGGNQALGWYKDGRWLCYYHPGDIGDAWCDDHAGVPRGVYEACYQLGTNVIFYAYMEHSKWQEAQKKDKRQ